MRRPALALALLVVVSATLASVVAASPQPTPVCGVCGGGLSDAAAGDEALDGLTVERSTAIIRVRDDGSATWRVANHLANDSVVAYLDEHPAAVDRLAADALQWGTVDGPFRNLSATLDGSTLRVRFADPDAVRRTPGGIRIVEYLHSRGYDTWPVLTADELTVVGPAGTTVTNDPPGATVEGRNATWHGNASANPYEAPTVETDAYVAFGNGGPGSALLTWLGVAVATAPMVIDVLTTVHVPPLVVLAAGLVVLSLVGRAVFRDSTMFGHDRVAGAVAALGALGVCAGVLGIVLPRYAGTRWLVELGVLYVSLGAVAAWRGPQGRTRDLLAAGALALVVIAVALAVTLTSEFVTPWEAFRDGFDRAIRLSPLVAMVAAGAAAASADRAVRFLGPAMVLATFFVAELSMAWPTQRPFGLVRLLFAGGAVLVVVLGAPLFFLGGVRRERPAAGDSDPERSDPERSDPVTG